jgi:hypothetical protein
LPPSRAISRSSSTLATHPSLGRSDQGERVKTRASADHNHPTMALTAGTVVVSDSDALGGNGQ